MQWGAGDGAGLLPPTPTDPSGPGSADPEVLVPGLRSAGCAAQEMAPLPTSRPQFPHLSDGLLATANLSKARLGTLLNAKTKRQQKGIPCPASQHLDGRREAGPRSYGPSRASRAAAACAVPAAPPPSLGQSQRESSLRGGAARAREVSGGGHVTAGPPSGAEVPASSALWRTPAARARPGGRPRCGSKGAGALLARASGARAGRATQAERRAQAGSGVPGSLAPSPVYACLRLNTRWSKRPFFVVFCFF